MSLRVVLYAEGAGETGGGIPPAPGALLPEERLGAGHILLRRAIAEVRDVQAAFHGPLRDRGRAVVGSMLLDRRVLRRVLPWLDPALRPDLAVVLVDADGTSGRRRELEVFVHDIATPHVIGVARQEFEAWLVADEGALASRPPRSKAPERLKPREAKALLAGWFGDTVPAEARRSVASRCRLDVVARRCPSFKRLLNDLERV